MQSVLDTVGSEMQGRLGVSQLKFKVDRSPNEGSSSRLIFEPRNEAITLIAPISDRFNTEEVSALLKRAMKDRKLDTTFEFGVLKGGMPKIYSPHFLETLRSAEKDSANLRTFITLLSGNIVTPLSGELFVPETAETLFVIVPESNLRALRSLSWMILGSVLFTVIIIAAFFLTVRTLLGQKKLSEIKSDFINNMTHELKTPLATISLAIDAIGNEKVMENREKIRYFSGIIKEENRRMNKQVESILQSALLEKEEIALNLQPLDVHQLITRTVENLQLQLNAKNGKVHLQLNAHQPIIKADEVHFSNLIFNLLDNAIKYSKDNLEVRIATNNTRRYIVISIADNGIGMSRDTVSRIFEKFYRAHTGNVHNVKGFGLGLSYVKAIVDAHKGKIRVESILGKGSRFTLEFPQD